MQYRIAKVMKSSFIFLLIFLTFKVNRSFAILCYKCDSVTLPKCASSVNSEDLPTEECDRAFSCASSIVDSVTYRGCSTNTPRGPKYYKTCSEPLCNKGVYPPGRLKCHKCSGNSICVPKPLNKPIPCVNFFEDDSCYTDVIDEIETYRGCDSDTERNRTGFSVFCNENGCNELEAVSQLTCSKCDSNETRGCKIDLFEINNASCVITNSNICTDLILLGHEQPSCFLYKNLDHVVRGCTYDSGLLSLDAKNFDECQEELCNKKCLKQQKCIVCDSKTNRFCKNDTKTLTATSCEGAEASSCYLCEFDDGSIRRGCGVPPSATAARCNHCQEEGCNQKNFTKCFQCSSDDNPNCSQWTNPNIIGVENCEISAANCVSAVLSNGKTLRGCQSSQLECNGTQLSCHSCSGNLCNEGVYPPMRLQCHHCDGRQKCSEIVDDSNMLPCAKYEKDDACFEFLSNKGTMVRGCRSDQNLFYECLLADKNGYTCRLCAQSGCNMTPKSKPPSLLCHNCSRTHKECSWQQGNDTMVNCQKEVQFMSLESCFTRRYLDGSTSRGCSLDEKETDEIEEFLEGTCTDDGCNGKSQVAQKCVVCTGSVYEENICTANVGILERPETSLCKNGSLKYEERGCYIQVDGGNIKRGCASDFTSTELKKCQNSNTSDCYYCQGLECNTSSNLTFIIVRNLSTRLFRASVLIQLFSLLIIFKM